jgi:hypothetical protein
VAEDASVQRVIDEWEKKFGKREGRFCPSRNPQDPSYGWEWAAWMFVKPRRPVDRRISQSRYDASVCGECGRALGPEEPVWICVFQLVARAESGLMKGLREWRLDGAVCERCWNNPDTYTALWGYVSTWARPEPEPCGHCGRMVTRNPRALSYCSTRCQAAANRERKRKARRYVCEACQSEYTPARSDSRYCSSACRQRAYRERAKRA